MALISELLANIILSVTRPFSLLKLAYLFGVRTALIVINTWVELVRATVNFHVNIIWGIITWTVGLISLPARVANAFQRERQGAATTCYVALHPQVKGISGKYFSDSNVAETTSQGRDADLAKKLWDFSMNLIK